MIGGSVQVSLGVRFTGQIAPPGTAPGNTIPRPSQTVSGGGSQTLSFGTQTGQADEFANGEYLIGPSSSLTLDLYAGDLPNMVTGAACPFRLVKSVVVVINKGTGNSSGVRIGGAGGSEWVGFFDAAGQKIKIFPGGPPFVAGSPAGVVVDNTHKLFKIENLSSLVSAQVRVYAAGNLLTGGQSLGWLLLQTYP